MRISGGLHSSTPATTLKAPEVLWMQAVTVSSDALASCTARVAVKRIKTNVKKYLGIFSSLNDEKSDG